MKAITILQPWASLIARGAKKIETRGWATKYRGPIAIHAAKDQDKNGERIRHIVARAEQYGIVLPDMQFGAVIAIAELVDCIEMTDDWIGYLPQQELVFGWYDIDRVAWKLANVRPIDPVQARGKQRLWEWEAPGWLDL
ncbi:ASCH domain-containing protein [Sporomusa sp. KB1]|jgi:hypothetical protein|uniref:ASCH domain-containing protein n=1 Tax=Sporomusa sp. KB1 TaxID=943346 RepID=UPI0011AB28D4|nr:ASCH domain-containing protein [Sporomusa sp. KB1]TWH48530.1 ASCH domain-containing protein [Sporomusa sp. KB1]